MLQTRKYAHMLQNLTFVVLIALAYNKVQCWVQVIRQSTPFTLCGEQNPPSRDLNLHGNNKNMTSVQKKTSLNTLNPNNRPVFLERNQESYIIYHCQKQMYGMSLS